MVFTRSPCHYISYDGCCLWADEHLGTGVFASTETYVFRLAVEMPIGHPTGLSF